MCNQSCVAAASPKPTAKRPLRISPTIRGRWRSSSSPAMAAGRSASVRSRLPAPPSAASERLGRRLDALYSSASAAAE